METLDDQNLRRAFGPIMRWVSAPAGVNSPARAHRYPEKRSCNLRLRNAFLYQLIEFREIDWFDEMMLESSLATLSDIFFHTEAR